MLFVSGSLHTIMPQQFLDYRYKTLRKGVFDGPKRTFLFFSKYKDKYTTNLTIPDDNSVDGKFGTQTQGRKLKAQTNPLSYGSTKLNVRLLLQPTLRKAL